MRVWIASIGPSRHDAAGTYEPIDASSTISATWRMKVLLPPMFGPVMTSMRRRASRRQSLAMNGVPLSCRRASTTGWRPRSISISGSLTKRGRHHSPRRATSASAASASSDASERATRRDRLEVRRERVEQRLVERLLARQRALARRQRLVLERLQLRRDEALGVLHRLAAPVVGRHLRRLPLRDLDEVAVDAIELDAQRRDAGALALLRLELDQVGVAAAADRAQLVELGVDAGGDDAAVAQAAPPARRRWPRARSRSRPAARAPRRACRAGPTPSAGTAARTRGSASSVARRPASSRGRTWRSAMRAPMRSTSREMAQRLAQRAVRAAEQRGDRVVAVDRDAAVAQRLRQPLAQCAAAHAGDAEIDRRQQRRRVAAAQRPRQLEVAVRDRRQVDQLARSLHLQAMDVGERAALRVLGVGEQRAGGGVRCRQLVGAEGGERGDAQLLAEHAMAERAVELPGGPARDRRRAVDVAVAGRGRSRSTITSAGASRASQPAKLAPRCSRPGRSRRSTAPSTPGRSGWRRG